MPADIVHGLSRYKKFGCRCEECVSSYELHKLQRRKSKPKVYIPSAPLVRLLEERFPGRALEMRDTLRGWRRRGTIDLYEADKICIRIGLHPYEVFGDLYFTGLEEDELVEI